MDEEILMNVSMTLDNDGFLRRECPACERQFKWFSHEEGASEAEDVDQYFCPHCGEVSEPNSWWTPEQLEYIELKTGPEIAQHLQATLDKSFKNLPIEIEHSSTQTSIPDPPGEPDDMNIVAPPCHPNEPIKMPDESMNRIHCLICGQMFAA